MASVRIIATPAGEAPLSVREAWVGLLLPLKKKYKPVPTKIPVFGLLTAPKSVIGQIIALILGRYDGFKEVYLVDSVGAIEVLKTKDAEAAQWWLVHAPHTISPRKSFGFEVDVCELAQDTQPRVSEEIGK